MQLLLDDNKKQVEQMQEQLQEMQKHTNIFYKFKHRKELKKQFTNEQ